MGTSTKRALTLALALVALVLGLAACGDEDDAAPAPGDDATDGDAGGTADDEDRSVTVYSGRSEELVGPILDRFAEETGIEVQVRYGDTAEMAATILEEGGNSPADVYYGQDAGALGALKQEGRLVDLPDDVLESVDARFADPDGQWVGMSGRARVVAYNTEAVDEADLPDSILGFADDEWEGRIGWAPTNGSLQAHITAMRVELGDDVVGDWLEGMVDNGVTYENNTAIVEALGRGEVEVGLANHYYLYRFLEEDPDFPVENAFLASGDIGNLINIAGAGVVDTADDEEAAFELLRYLLTDESQAYFAEEVFEFPLVPGVEVDPRLPSMEEIDSPDIDLSRLEDLEGTLELMRERGAVP
jgi:iron(III) transport system substrate-binding protein